MLNSTAGPPAQTLRARAQRRRETAARLWDERLERLLLDEAGELERRAEALELEAAIHAEEPNGTAQSIPTAALREEGRRR